MKALVTGVAGFIGGTLACSLRDAGWHVCGIDRRLRAGGDLDGIETIQADLSTVDLARVLDRVDTVFHLAGQTGVRPSWSHDFELYVRDNVLTTQRLLQAVRDTAVRRFVYASSSSVYGTTDGDPSREVDRVQPHSPYGVSKLAAEQLCHAYASNFGVPTVALRYFTVYGPGQRSDMAIHRLVDAALHETPFDLYGDGSQARDFTFVEDTVRATVDAATADIAPGTTINIASGSAVTIRAVIESVEKITGRPITVNVRHESPGDVQRTAADIDRARTLLGWRPRVDLPTGLTAQVAHQLDRSGVGAVGD